MGASSAEARLSTLATIFGIVSVGDRSTAIRFLRPIRMTRNDSAYSGGVEHDVQREQQSADNRAVLDVARNVIPNEIVQKTSRNRQSADYRARYGCDASDIGECQDDEPGKESELADVEGSSL